MSRPTDAGAFAEAIYAQMAPVTWDDENQGWALLIYLGALGQMFQDLDTLAHDDEIPFSTMVDIDRVPDEALPWLGQFVGTEIDTSLTTDQQRQQIRDREGWARGRFVGLRRAIIRTGDLHGSQAVVIRERFLNPYNFQVITYPSETTVAPLSYQTIYDEYATYNDLMTDFSSYLPIYVRGLGVSLKIWNAIAKNKPAALTFDYKVQDPNDYWGLWADFSTYLKIYTDFPTYNEVYNYTTNTGSPGVSIGLGSVVDYAHVYSAYQTYQDILDFYATY